MIIKLDIDKINNVMFEEIGIGIYSKAFSTIGKYRENTNGFVNTIIKTEKKKYNEILTIEFKSGKKFKIDTKYENYKDKLFIIMTEKDFEEKFNNNLHSFYTYLFNELRGR